MPLRSARLATCGRVAQKRERQLIGVDARTVVTTRIEVGRLRGRR
jgi:hypothetical protein